MLASSDKGYNKPRQIVKLWVHVKRCKIISEKDLKPLARMNVLSRNFFVIPVPAALVRLIFSAKRRDKCYSRLVQGRGWERGADKACSVKPRVAPPPEEVGEIGVITF